MRTASLAAACVALALQGAWAEPGRTAGGTLRRPLGARGVGLAEAFSAVEGGLDSLSYNPAGLSGVSRRELKTVYHHGIVEDHFTYVAYGHPLKRAVITAGLVYYDAGSISLNLSSGVRETRKVQQDYVGVLGGAVPLGGGLTAGAVLKYYRFELAEEARASGAAMDAGALWKSPLRGLSFGAAMQNAGPDVKFEQEGDPLPLTARAGAAYMLDLSAVDAYRDATVAISQFLFTAEALQIRNEKLAAATGLEMRMPLADHGFGALRVGYMFNRDIDALSLGLGLKEGRFLFDYALGVKKDINKTHHFSIGILF